MPPNPGKPHIFVYFLLKENGIDFVSVFVGLWAQSYMSVRIALAFPPIWLRRRQTTTWLVVLACAQFQAHAVVLADVNSQQRTHLRLRIQLHRRKRLHQTRQRRHLCQNLRRYPHRMTTRALQVGFLVCCRSLMVSPDTAMARHEPLSKRENWTLSMSKQRRFVHVVGRTSKLPTVLMGYRYVVVCP